MLYCKTSQKYDTTKQTSKHELARVYVLYLRQFMIYYKHETFKIKVTHLYQKQQ